ncbi:hypothetical protein SUDANB140_02367 [Streptomyces sp. enrichment culture]
MSEAVPYLVTLGCLTAVMGVFTWLKRLVLRRGLAGSALRGALASYEEAMRVTSHESHIEIRAQDDRRTPVVSDDPRWTGRTAAGASAVRAKRSRRTGRRRLRRLLRRWDRTGPRSGSPRQSPATRSSPLVPATASAPSRSVRSTLAPPARRAATVAGAGWP